MTETKQFTIRAAVDSDGSAVATIMAKCFLQFPGCYFDVGENKDIQRPASTYRQKGGVYLVVQNPLGQIVGCAGIKRTDPVDVAPASADWELSRFYIRPSLQGAKLGTRLIDLLTDFATSNGGGSLVAWSDTRFLGAHQFYQRHGMTKLDMDRPLHDLSLSEEYAFYKEI